MVTAVLARWRDISRHIPRNARGNALCLFCVWASTFIAARCGEQCQPTIKILFLEGLLLMNLAMDVHCVAVITLLPKQELLPVTTDKAQVFWQINLCDI